MKPRVLIRVDGYKNIGLGHLVRCLALAHMLASEFDITFFCIEIPDDFLPELNRSGFDCIKIKKEADFFYHLSNDTIAVLDGYNFDSEYQIQTKATGTKLICIDDLHDKEFYADLIINHTPGISIEDYKAQTYTQFALGLEYALLRPAFLEQAKRPRTIRQIETVLICFGGSDPKNITEKILRVVIDFSQFKKIIVVTGVVYFITNSFLRLVKSDYRIDHRQSLNEQHMLSAMLESDLAIVPASGILFEALAVRSIVITSSHYNNQDFILKGFANLKIVENYGAIKNLRNVLKKVSEDTFLSQVSLIDGASNDRICKKIKALLK